MPGHRATLITNKYSQLAKTTGAVANHHEIHVQERDEEHHRQIKETPRPKGTVARIGRPSGFRCHQRRISFVHPITSARWKAC
jgi:hypothetical protein